MTSLPRWARVLILLGILIALAAAGEPYATFSLYALIAVAIAVVLEWGSGARLSWE